MNQQVGEDQAMVNANANESVQENQQVVMVNANVNANEEDDDEDDAWVPQLLDEESHAELDNDTDADIVSMADSDIGDLDERRTRNSSRPIPRVIQNANPMEEVDDDDEEEDDDDDDAADEEEDDADGSGNANGTANNVETSNTVETNGQPNGNGEDVVMKIPSWVCLPSEDTEYSDWQIDIRFHDSMDVTSYLVHRYRIGPQSAYFNMIFRDEKSFLESNSKRSFIELPENTPVDIRKTDFELFLSFLYLNDGEQFSWGRSDVLSMFYLADYFGVKELRTEALEKAKRFSSEDEEWAGTAYCFAESLALKDLKVEIQKLCYTQNKYKHADLWNVVADQGWKHNLLKGIQKLWRKDINEGNMDEAKAKRWYSIVGNILQSDPHLVDQCLLLEIQVDLVRDRNRFGIGRVLNGRHALEYLKRERELGLDAQEMDGLTTFQEEFVQSFYYKKTDAAELPDIIEALQDLKPSITKNLLCFCLQNNND